MNSHRATLAMVFQQCETWGNALALLLCWGAAIHFLAAGRAALAAGGYPPLAPHALLAAVMAPGAAYRVLDWTAGAAEIGLAGVLALSAAEGSWWLLRRVLPVAA